jgi:hypothetical protein
MIEVRSADSDADFAGYADGRDVELVRELGEEPPSVSPPGIEIKEVTPAEHDAVYAVAVEC